MEHPEFLKDIVILLATTLLVARLFLFLRAPSIIGFLLAGIAIGPFGARLIGHEEVGGIAELGLVLLLFVIGLELSPKPLIRMGKSLLTASMLQIGVTAALAAAALLLFTSLNLVAATIIGLGVALSSTAIVLKQLSDLGASSSLRGMIITGILLIQDVLVILLLLFLPFLSPQAEGDWTDSALRGLLGLGGIVILSLVARVVLPLFLKHVVRPGGKEFITLFAILMAFGGAWLAGVAGWSLPLGACIAGLLLSETTVRHQLVAEVLPFRNVFNALFFVSLGMLFDPQIIADHFVALIAAVAVTVVLKTIISTSAVVAARWPLMPALDVGLGLCTVSEFGYVLVNEATKLQLVPESSLDIFIVYALGTMMTGALLIPFSQPVTGLVARVIYPDTPRPKASSDEEPSLKDHVIIVGYGINGQNLVRVLKSTAVPHRIIEMNPNLAEEAKKEGAEVIQGDGCRISILEHAGLRTARALIVAINDPTAARRIVAQASAARPDLYILARTHFDSDLDGLYELGANDVISEDFETSIEIAAHLLRELDVPDNIIEAQLASLRSGRYAMLRGMPTTRTAINELGSFLEATGTRTHYVAEDSPMRDKSIADTDLRARTGVMIIAVVRNGKPTTNPPPDMIVETGDVLVLVGSHAQLDEARLILGT